MDSGYMSKIAYSRIGVIFGYHNMDHIHHIDLYARPEGVRERSGGCLRWCIGRNTGVSRYSQVVFQRSRSCQNGLSGIGPKMAYFMI